MITGYVVGGLLVLVLVPYLLYRMTFLLNTLYSLEIISNPVLRWIIIGILLSIGIYFAIRSLVFQNTIGKGGPVEIGKIKISPKTEHLVVTGPYKYTRNPMLFGTFSIYLAFALFLNAVNAVLLVCAFVVFMLTVVVPKEEKRLVQDFGEEYIAYRKKVSLFFPWIQKNKQNN
ncbi:MAG: isoprenylcysteine carboxylmethyltransferase family protein [Paludibacter sp.]|nr:isoprenylcysteine carboxylmethyltransferase family protein [Paludibacter sp.]